MRLPKRPMPIDDSPVLEQRMTGKFQQCPDKNMADSTTLSLHILGISKSTTGAH